ncbi:MAG: hypothetical protein WCE62_00730, partial [Polyangiales bacterium]
MGRTAARLAGGFLGVLVLAMLPGISTCNTTCTYVDPWGNPVRLACVECSVAGSVPCMRNAWYLPVGSTCLDEQRPTLADGSSCDFEGAAGECIAGTCAHKRTWSPPAFIYSVDSGYLGALDVNANGQYATTWVEEIVTPGPPTPVV